MKKIFLILALFSVSLFAQWNGSTNKVLRERDFFEDYLEQVKDSMGIDSTILATLPDSIIYTSETADFVTKSTSQTITGQKNFGTVTKFGGSDSTIAIYPDSIVIIKGDSPYKYILFGRTAPTDTSYLQLSMEFGGLVLSPRTNASGVGEPNKTTNFEMSKTNSSGNNVFSLAISEDRLATDAVVFRLMNADQDGYVPLIVKNIQVIGEAGEGTFYSYAGAVAFRNADTGVLLPLSISSLNSLNASETNTIAGNTIIEKTLSVRDPIIYLDSAVTIKHDGGILRFYQLDGVTRIPIVVKDVYMGDTSGISTIYSDSTLKIKTQAGFYSQYIEAGGLRLPNALSIPDTIAGWVSLFADSDELKVRDANGDITVLSDLIGVPDTTGITEGYVPKKQADGTILWQPDISTSGSGLFNPDGVTIDTTAGGLARVLPAKVTKWDSVTVKLDKSDSTTYLTPYDATQAYQPKDADLDNPDLALNLVQDSLDVKANRSELGTGAYATIANYSLTSHTHTEFTDTLSKSWGVMDTVTTGDYTGWKVDNNITITEISAYTNTGTVTFNIEERVETTPNTAGVDVIGSDLVADTDQQETGTFSNAAIDRDDWLVPTVTSISGDPTIFSITVRYVKTN